MPEFDVIGIGENSVDTVLTVSGYPPCGGKARITSEAKYPGGQVATAMAACAQLGLRAKYIGTVGDDEHGTIQIESLRRLGINSDDVHRRLNCASRSAYVVIDEPTGERTVYWNRHECLRLNAGEIPERQIAAAGLLLIDCTDPGAAEYAVRTARGHGVPVVLDVDVNYPGIDSVLPFVDYLIANESFPPAWSEMADPFEALAALQTRFGMRMVAMTLGPSGALARSEGQYFYSPGYEVNCVDTTGGGDVFHGAFCYSVVQKMPIAEALEFANAMAALNCTGIGARGHIASVDEVRSLMNDGTRRTRSDIAFRTQAG